MQIETVKVVNPAGGYTIINADDFVEGLHKVFKEAKQKPEPKPAEAPEQVAE